jgi:hypothetical protein
MREKHKLRVIENGMLMNMFGPRRDEVTMAEGNCSLGKFMICKYPCDQIKNIEIGGACDMYGENGRCTEGFY